MLLCGDVTVSGTLRSIVYIQVQHWHHFRCPRVIGLCRSGQGRDGKDSARWMCCLCCLPPRIEARGCIKLSLFLLNIFLDPLTEAHQFAYCIYVAVCHSDCFCRGHVNRLLYLQCFIVWASQCANSIKMQHFAGMPRAHDGHG